MAIPLERDEGQRQEYLKQAKDFIPDNLIFVDEMGINTNMMRRYGRAPTDCRVEEVVPVNTPLNTTVIGALGIKELVGSMCIEGPADGDCFAEFIEQVLVPKLKPGQKVVMDNLGAHKSKRVHEAITRAGAKLVFLPAYSPDFNPIEECWPKMKETLRSIGAQTEKALWKGLATAIGFITPSDIRGWFDHCGYSSASG